MSTGGSNWLATLARHPRGLWVLAFTEIWERFSFYGVRSLLVLYLTSGALASPRFEHVYGSRLSYSLFGRPHGDVEVQALASQINEWYSGMAFVTPLLGGYVADRLLGIRNTCIFGGLLMVIAHALMAFERYFLIGLVFLIFGNGAFKPTISAQLSQLYDRPESAHMRESGFAMYFMAINIGALLAPVVCGLLKEAISYHAGFGAAGVGMVGGLAIYLAGLRHLPAASKKAHGRDVDMSREEEEEAHPLTSSAADSAAGSTAHHSTAVPSSLNGRDACSSSSSSSRDAAGGGGPSAGISISISSSRDQEMAHAGSPKGSKLMGEAWPADGRWPMRRALALTAICAVLLPVRHRELV